MARPILRWLAVSVLLLNAPRSMAQPSRLRTYNAIGWLVATGDHRLTPKWALHTEYQWRRTDWLRAPQQHLIRPGVVRQLSARAAASVGYTLVLTARYGDYPIVAGRTGVEQRVYEDLTLRDAVGRLLLAHRWRLEQRWLAVRADAGQGDIAAWRYQNSIRYQLSAQWPLHGPTLEAGEWYLNALDEVFISFGRNVGNNVFNQNRIAGGVGYRVSPRAGVEVNYLNQTLQHPRPDAATGRPVFEYNHGLRLGLTYSLDFTTPATE